jgi:hypothetical protein
MSHTTILNWQGVTRTYNCDSYFDALVLHDCLTRAYGGDAVSVWLADKRVL